MTLTNAAIARLRISRAWGLRSSRWPKTSVHIHGEPTGAACTFMMRPTTTPSASTSKSSSFHSPNGREADAAQPYEPFLANVAVSNPVPSLTEFLSVVLFWLKPVRNLPVLLTTMGQAHDFIRFHNKTHRLGCSLGHYDPPIPHQSIDGSAERNGVTLRKRLDLKAKEMVGVRVICEKVHTSSVP